MSDVKEVSILEQYKQQHAMFCAQRDQVQNNYQQLLGAIYACETMIKQYEENLKKAVENAARDLNKGVIKDGEAKCETEEQAA
jgi:vacuolar-type H+-ATPase subunit D/Vma8